MQRNTRSLVFDSPTPQLNARYTLTLQVNPFAGVAFSWSAIGMGCLGALPIFLVSVLLEKSGVEFFRKIDQDTKLYTVQVFGADRNLPVRSSVKRA